MRILQSAIIACFLLVACPAMAQNSLSDILNPKVEEPAPDSRSLNDYANLYFEECATRNNVSEVQSYVDLQCACTAAEATSFMNKDDFRILLSDHQDRNYQITRLMLNAYIPCLKNSVGDFVYDQCLAGQYTDHRFSNKEQVCGCISESMAGYAVREGTHVVPGFRRFSFSNQDLGDSPFFSVVTNQSFSNVFDYYTPKCMRQNAYNF